MLNSILIPITPKRKDMLVLLSESFAGCTMLRHLMLVGILALLLSADFAATMLLQDAEAADQYLESNYAKKKRHVGSPFRKVCRLHNAAPPQCSIEILCVFARGLHITRSEVFYLTLRGNERITQIGVSLGTITAAQRDTTIW
jgi:hypothetical protein